MTTTNYKEMTYTELKAAAKANGIENAHKTKKTVLIEMLEALEAKKAEEAKKTEKAPKAAKKAEELQMAVVYKEKWDGELKVKFEIGKTKTQLVKDYRAEKLIPVVIFTNEQCAQFLNDEYSKNGADKVGKDFVAENVVVIFGTEVA